MFTYRSSSYS